MAEDTKETAGTATMPSPEAPAVPTPEPSIAAKLTAPDLSSTAKPDATPAPAEPYSSPIAQMEPLPIPPVAPAPNSEPFPGSAPDHPQAVPANLSRRKWLFGAGAILGGTAVAAGADQLAKVATGKSIVERIGDSLRNAFQKSPAEIEADKIKKDIANQDSALKVKEATEQRKADAKAEDDAMRVRLWGSTTYKPPEGVPTPDPALKTDPNKPIK